MQCDLVQDADVDPIPDEVKTLKGGGCTDCTPPILGYDSTGKKTSRWRLYLQRQSI